MPMGLGWVLLRGLCTLLQQPAGREAEIHELFKAKRVYSIVSLHLLHSTMPFAQTWSQQTCKVDRLPNMELSSCAEL